MDTTKKDYIFQIVVRTLRIAIKVKAFLAIIWFELYLIQLFLILIINKNNFITTCVRRESQSLILFKIHILVVINCFTAKLK